MSLSDYDRMLLDRCLRGGPRAWEDFVDRFLGLVLHVAQHSADSRGLSLDPSGRDDLVADVFVKLLENDYAILRRFRRQCSLATYLAVISRRVIVRRLLRDQLRFRTAMPADPLTQLNQLGSDDHHETRFDNREHVEKLLLRLDQREAQIVRMYHLEGKSYREISVTMGIAENTIGPTLSRARAHLRK